MPDVKRFAVAGGVVVVLLLLFWRAAAPVSHPSAPSEMATLPTTQQTASSLAVPSPGSEPARSASAPSPAISDDRSAPTRVYAVALPDLPGLPEDAKPGTSLELWVAWEPPVTKHPRIQRLATGVTLDRIVPPVVADGAPAALLRIPIKEMASVLYGDRYGALSAVITGA